MCINLLLLLLAADNTYSLCPLKCLDARFCFKDRDLFFLIIKNSFPLFFVRIYLLIIYIINKNHPLLIHCLLVSRNKIIFDKQSYPNRFLGRKNLQVSTILKYFREIILSFSKNDYSSSFL